MAHLAMSGAALCLVLLLTACTEQQSPDEAQKTKEEMPSTAPSTGSTNSGGIVNSPSPSSGAPAKVAKRADPLILEPIVPAAAPKMRQLPPLKLHPPLDTYSDIPAKLLPAITYGKYLPGTNIERLEFERVEPMVHRLRRSVPAPKDPDDNRMFSLSSGLSERRNVEIGRLFHFYEANQSFPQYKIHALPSFAYNPLVNDTEEAFNAKNVLQNIKTLFAEADYKLNDIDLDTARWQIGRIQEVFFATQMLSNDEVGHEWRKYIMRIFLKGEYATASFLGDEYLKHTYEGMTDEQKSNSNPWKADRNFLSILRFTGLRLNEKLSDRNTTEIHDAHEAFSLDLEIRKQNELLNDLQDTLAKINSQAIDDPHVWQYFDSIIQQESWGTEYIRRVLKGRYSTKELALISVTASILRTGNRS